MSETLGKKYMLCSKKQIQSLFEVHNSVKLYPFVVRFNMLESTESAPFKLVLSVPKRNFKKAHDRNRIKRLMKEGIRKNKLILESNLKENNNQLILFVIYTAKDEMDYDFILGKTKQLFKHLSHEISINISSNV